MKKYYPEKDYIYKEITELIGKTIFAITVDDINQEYIYFRTSENRLYVMFHAQDCCEDVYIESITGDIENLIGTPILFAEEVIDHIDSEECWTFYKISTIKGDVTIRWQGGSNGYYSMEASFAEIVKG